MKIIFDFYKPKEEIPVDCYIKNKKLIKYLNRETMAAVVGVGKLINIVQIKPTTPFYYATGLLEYEDYGLKNIVEGSLDKNKKFFTKLFIEKGLLSISPLNQFKVLQNMPLSFVSINYDLRGDNAVVYSSASALLFYISHSLDMKPVLIGAGKVYKDGSVESSFALINKDEIEDSSFNSEAIEMFRLWSKEANI